MTGTVDELYLSALHARISDEEQQSLGEFTTTDTSDELGTTVAAVREPVGGIVESSDELRKELGMPEEHLDSLRKERLLVDSEDDVEQHNAAVEQLNLEDKYVSHLRTDEDARTSVRELAQRVRDDEDITVVCFEKSPKWCHRHVLKDEIERLV